MLLITLNKFWETNELLLLLESSKYHILPNDFRRIRSYIIYLDLKEYTMYCTAMFSQTRITYLHYSCILQMTN